MIMKQIIPFKKELPFKTKVSDITSISLERELGVLGEGVITGTFHITGDYKMNEGSINRENFSFDLPFDITLDPRYDINSVNTDIEDFYYDVINEDTLKVNIDLFVEAEYLPIEEEIEVREEVEVCEEVEEECEEVEEECDNIEEPERIKPVAVENDLVEEKDERDDIDDFTSDLFSNLDDKETYTTYYVYIVKEEDTIDKILVKYGVSKDDIESYNDITDIKPGDKIIIPKASE